MLDGSSDRGSADRLYLTFRLAADRYALEVSRIAEVLPLVGIKQLPRSPEGPLGHSRLFGEKRHTASPYRAAKICASSRGSGSNFTEN
jgi:hypothetical protein